MKTFLLLLVLVTGLGACCNCTEKDPSEKILEAKDPAENYTIVLDTSADKRYRSIVFQTASGYDTLLTSVRPGFPCSLQTVQLDGKGLKEVMISWKEIRFVDMYTGNAVRWDAFLHLRLHEIWSLEKKEKLFSATSHYAYVTESRQDYHRQRSMPRFFDSTWYHYDLRLEENGKLLISDTTSHAGQWSRGSEWEKGPDHAKGTYVYSNGKFVQETHIEFTVSNERCGKIPRYTSE